MTLRKSAQEKPKKFRPARLVKGKRPYVVMYIPVEGQPKPRRIRLYPPPDKRKPHEFSRWRYRVIGGYELLVKAGYVLDWEAPGEVPMSRPSTYVEPPKPKNFGGVAPPSNLLHAIQWALASKGLEVSPRTRETYKVVYARVSSWLATDQIGNMLLRDFGTEHVAALSDHMLRTGMAGVTRNNYFQTLRSIFTRLVSAKAIAKNPFSNFRKVPQVRTANNAALPPEVAAAILAHLEAKDPALLMFVRMVYWSFARPIELCRLRVADVGEDCASLHFRATETKNKRAAVVPLPSACQVMLQQYLAADPVAPSFHLLGTKGRPQARQVGENTFSERHRKALRQLGLDGRGFNLYSWKHTGVAAAYDAGMSLMELRDRCRHASVQQTEEYLRDLRRITRNEPPAAW